MATFPNLDKPEPNKQIHEGHEGTRRVGFFFVSLRELRGFFLA